MDVRRLLLTSWAGQHEHNLATLHWNVQTSPGKLHMRLLLLC